MTLPVEVNPTLMYKSGGGYQIPRSLRFRASASANLTRTPASNGNRSTWTISFWMKRGALTSSAFQNLFLSQALGSSTNYAYLGLDYTSGFGNGCLVFEDFTSSVSRGLVKTNALFRDPSAWYHVILAFDTTNATAADRIRIYVNGVQQTLTITTQIAQNTVGYMNTGSAPHFIGSNNSNPSSNFFDGYLTEVNFIDGQALTPSSFGETDITTGVWKPKKYTGSYGTNGFYLNFSDNSAATAAAIGKDSSGNGNNWTPTNISVTAGVTYDSMIDTPTPYDDGTVYGRGNYATLNPLFVPSGTAPSISQGNLYYNKTVTATYGLSRGNIGVSSGKFYWEVTIASKSTHVSAIGAENEDNGNTSDAYFKPTSYTYCSNGNKANNNTQAAYGASWTTGDVLSVALDMTAGTITFYKNGASQGTAFTGLSGTIIPNISTEEGAGTLAAHFNFGQRPFAYTPPSGFKALNTQNLPTPTIVKPSTAFNTVLYTGNGSTQTISGLEFSPDLVWIKRRSSAEDHALFDTVRGSGKYLKSNTTSTEFTLNSTLNTFNADGFTLGSAAITNTSSATYVAWAWDEGATPGFDVVTYTGTGATRTVAHNLGVAPAMMIVRNRDSAQNWVVYHKNSNATPQNYILRFNTTDAALASSGSFNNTAPTSTEFTVGTLPALNGSGNNMLAYLWAEVPGFSKFGSYTGNGSTDGPFVYCGFRPRWLMIKGIAGLGTQTNGYWVIVDTVRATYNVIGNTLMANDTGSETTWTYSAVVDVLSNGFKPRMTGDICNNSGGSYIFAAFAENPFKYALAR